MLWAIASNPHSIFTLSVPLPQPVVNAESALFRSKSSHLLSFSVYSDGEMPEWCSPYLYAYILMHSDSPWSPHTDNNPAWFHNRLPLHIFGFPHAPAVSHSCKQSGLLPAHRADYPPAKYSPGFSSSPSKIYCVLHNCPHSFLLDIHNSLRFHILHPQSRLQVSASVFLQMLQVQAHYFCVGWVGMVKPTIYRFSAPIWML